MCNTVHKYPDNNFTKPPKSGQAWKLFITKESPVTGEDKYCQLCSDSRGYKADHDGWIRWYMEMYTNMPHAYDEDDIGFCFFPTREEAESAFDAMKGLRIFDRKSVNLRIIEVSYRKGIGEFSSNELDRVTRRFLIAKEFKPMEELEWLE